MKLQDLDDYNSLTGLIIGEARGEPLLGKLAVACVVRNRLEDPRWPSTWKGVIFQKMQFSCMNSLPRNGEIQLNFYLLYFKPDRREMYWRECKLAAYGAIHDYYADITNGANHYYANYIDPPYWAGGQTPVLEVGKHIFFKL